MNENVQLSPESLVTLLNLIHSNVLEDRKYALQHHKLISDLIQKRVDEKEESVIKLLTELDINAPDLTASLEKFLNCSSEASDKLLKIAKMVSDFLISSKQQKNEDLTEQEKLSLIETITNMKNDEDAKPAISIGDEDFE